MLMQEPLKHEALDIFSRNSPVKRSKETRCGVGITFEARSFEALKQWSPEALKMHCARIR
jgi:hypothetical protein